MKNALIAFACAGSIGCLFGWGFTEKRPTASLPEKEPVSARPVVRAKWSNTDFLNTVHEQASRWGKVGRNPLAEKLADWSDREIIDALNASLSNPDIMLVGSAGKGLASYLLAEWMRRDFAAALAWFDKLESRSTQSILGLNLDRLWPADKAEEGLAFLRSHPGMFGSHNQIIVNVLGLRARQGAAEVEGLLKIMREENIDFTTSHPIDFPADFDFPELAGSEEFKALWDRDGGTMFLRGWCARNRDAAFDWLLENHGVKALSSDMLMSAGDSQGHMKWLGTRIDALDPAERDEYVARNRRNWLQSPGTLVSFSKGISDPGLLAELRATGVQSIHGGNVQQVIPLLEEIEDPAKRIEILETTPLPSDEDNIYVAPRFNKVVEAQLRKKLAEWDAPQKRIEAIITRFKP